MTTGKLDDQLEDKKASIKFTNYAIDNFQYDFTNTKGKSGAVKLENSGVKGLKLVQYKKSKKKYLIMLLIYFRKEISILHIFKACFSPIFFKLYFHKNL